MVLHELLSYEVLRLIWWLLIGVLLVAFAITDGFDLGTGMLLPIAGRTDTERRVVINSVLSGAHSSTGYDSSSPN